MARLFFLLALVAVVGGCSLLAELEDSPITISAPTPTARPAHASIDSFSFSGRIALRHGENSFAVNLAWQHQGGRHAPWRDEILLTSPLGQGIAELARDVDGARLTTSERREYRADDWEGLSGQVFGIHLPLSALPRWLIADVPGGATEIEFDNTGRVSHFTSDGWRVDYLDYENDEANALPALIELKRDDIEARLKIVDWERVDSR